MVGSGHGDVLGGDGGLNVTAEWTKGIYQRESIVRNRGVDKILVAIAPPEGDQRRRARGGDVQAGEGMSLQYFIPFEVLDDSAIFNFDGVQCNFILRNRSGGDDLSRAASCGWKGVERGAGIRILWNVTVSGAELNIGSVALVVGRHLGEGRNLAPANAHQHRAARWLRAQGGSGYAKLAILTEVIVRKRVRADRWAGGSFSPEQQHGGKDPQIEPGQVSARAHFTGALASLTR